MHGRRAWLPRQPGPFSQNISSMLHVRRFLLALCILPLADGASAQTLTGETPLRANTLASPLLPADHWAFRAVRTLEARGLVTGYLPPQRSVPRAMVAHALQEALRRAPGEAPDLAKLAEEWSRRFAEEFPRSIADNTPSGVRFSGGWVVTAYEERQFDADPTLDSLSPATRLKPPADQELLKARTSLSVSAGPHLSLLVEPEVGSSGLRLGMYDIVAGIGPISLAFGRQSVGYGYAATGGVVLSGAVPIHRAQMQTSMPVVLPGIFKYLGPTAAHTSMSRFSEDVHAGNPMFWSASIAIQPHSRLTFALYRAALFGGKNTRARITPGNFLRVVAGLYTDSTHFENQVASGELRYRLPTEAVLPLVLYGEWGADDGAGALDEAPGAILGTFIPTMPKVPQLSLGVEYSYLGIRCCRVLHWYRSSEYLYFGADDRPLGHPLGGNGSEWLLYGHVDALDARLRVGGRAFWRKREENTMYGSLREGSSSGFAAQGAWRIYSHGDLRFSFTRERGADWSEHHFEAGATVFF